MTDLSSGFISSFATVVAAAVSRELWEWLPYLSQLVVVRASRRVPVDFQARFAEEWAALVHDTPGRLSKLAVAVGCYRAAFVVDREHRIPTASLTSLALIRFFEIVISVFSLILTSPLWVALLGKVAAAKKIGGPLFYGQRYLGRDFRWQSLYMINVYRLDLPFDSQRRHNWAFLARYVALHVAVIRGNLSFLGAPLITTANDIYQALVRRGPDLAVAARQLDADDQKFANIPINSRFSDLARIKPGLLCPDDYDSTITDRGRFVERLNLSEYLVTWWRVLAQQYRELREEFGRD